MPLPAELLEAIGYITAAAGSAFLGGKNSLNGFKHEVRQRFDHIDDKLNDLFKADGDHEARLRTLEQTENLTAGD